MFTVDDYCTPIQLAEKIIYGKTEVRTEKEIDEKLNEQNATPMQRVAIKLFGDRGNTDMFTLEEIKELSDYLLIFYNSHKDGD